MVLVMMSLSSCAQEHKKKNAHEGKANALIHESSPYLLQHAYNPVNWNPWGDVALEKAKKEDKLLIISVGYAACHWCHVMEHESFEDSTVAKVMNDSFVSIKVDREERPDIDQIYMQAAYLTNQRGGWPLNVIALPDGRPVYAGTYFPKDQWIKLLNYFDQSYQTDRQGMINQGDKYQQGINQIEAPILNLSDSLSFDGDQYNKFGQQLVGNMDPKFGGRKGAPKFPMPAVLEFLLQYQYYTDDVKSQGVLNTTLQQMARGGIYDQVGGGFARYSTDNEWTVPHFEKMLYDNGQLLSVYSKAYKVFKTEEYKEVAYQTYEFLERELSDQSGGFYSSLDADSEGEEGKFYVWTSQEIEQVLGDVSGVIQHYFGVTATGNFEGKNILTRRRALYSVAKKFALSESALKAKIDNAKSLLLVERAKRIRPGLDDKILTSWNALTVTGLLDAYEAFGDDRFLNRAIKCLTFISDKKSANDGGLLRNYKDGKASISAFNDDYALTIQALIKMYQATFDEKWLEKARKLKEYTNQYFFSEERKYFYYTSSKDKELIARKMELSDNVIPGANSVMAKALFQLGHYYYNQDDIRQAKLMLKGMEEGMTASPNFYSNWLQLHGLVSHRFYEVAIAGKEADTKRRKFSAFYCPAKILLGGKKEGNLVLMENKVVSGKTKIYVCEDKACKLPVDDVEKALTFLDK